MDFAAYLKFWTKVVPGKLNIVDERARSVFEIDFERLKEDGFKLVIFDVDDTIDDFHGEITTRARDFLKELQNSGYKVGVFSNSKKERMGYLNDLFKKLNIYNVYRSDKPNPLGFVEIMKHYEISPDNTIMVGDRIGTDILGAYLARIKKKILVEPFSEVFGGKKSGSFDRIIRKLEKLIYF